MKALILSTFLLFPVIIHAQRFSIGARTGIGKWEGPEYNGDATGKLIWEKELFGRVAIGKHFAFELGGFTQEGRKSSRDWYYIDTFHSSSLMHQYWKYAFYGVNFRAQYHIGHARHKGFHNYIGIVIAPSVEIRTDSSTEYIRATKETRTVFNDEHIKGWQVGIEDMIQYRISPNLAVHLLLSYRVGMFSTKGFLEAWSSKDRYIGDGIQAQLGVAYTFLKKEKPRTTAP